MGCQREHVAGAESHIIASPIHHFPLAFDGFVAPEHELIPFAGIFEVVPILVVHARHLTIDLLLGFQQRIRRAVIVVFEHHLARYELLAIDEIAHTIVVAGVLPRVIVRLLFAGMSMNEP